MKATLQQKEVFTVQVGDLTLNDVRIESQWCGLTRLVTAGGESLIVTGMADRKGGAGYGYRGAFGDIFDELFSTSASERKDASIEVLLVSPQLMEKIKAVTPKEAA